MVTLQLNKSIVLFTCSRFRFRFTAASWTTPSCGVDGAESWRAGRSNEKQKQQQLRRIRQNRCFQQPHFGRFSPWLMIADQTGTDWCLQVRHPQDNDSQTIHDGFRRCASRSVYRWWSNDRNQTARRQVRHWRIRLMFRPRRFWTDVEWEKSINQPAGGQQVVTTSVTSRAFRSWPVIVSIRLRVAP